MEYLVGKEGSKDLKIHWGNQKFAKLCWRTKFLINFRQCHSSIVIRAMGTISFFKTKKKNRT